MTCNTCNDCNPCEKEKKTCCELKAIAGDCVDVEEVDWQYVISATCPPRVRPWDNVSVSVKDSWVEGYSKDYTVNALNNKVGVCSDDDNPGPLNTKIRVQSPIEMRTVWCGSSNWHILLSLDEDALDVPDEKVAVRQWCGSKYLEDALEVDSNLIEANVVWCTMRITDKAPMRAYWRLTLTEDIIYSDLPWGSQMTFILATTDKPEFHPKWAQDYLVNTSYNSLWWLQINQRWLYIVWYTGSLEFAFGIHGARMQLYAIGSLWTTKPILESRYSAPVGEEPYQVDWMVSSDVQDPGLAKINFPVVAAHTHAGWITGMSASMWAYLARVPFWWSTILELDAGDIIFLWWKMQSNTEYRNWLFDFDDRAWYNEFAVLWSWGGAAWPNYWTSIYAAMICPL